MVQITKEHRIGLQNVKNMVAIQISEIRRNGDWWAFDIKGTKGISER